MKQKYNENAITYACTTLLLYYERGYGVELNLYCAVRYRKNT